MISLKSIKDKSEKIDEKLFKEELKKNQIMLQFKDQQKIKKWNKYRINQTWERMMDAGVLKYGLPVRLGNADGNYDGLIDCFKNETVYIIGGGISGRGFDFNKLNKCHTITVNHMIEYYDKSEIHYFMDQRFLRINKYNFENYKGTCIYSNNNNWTPPNNKYYMVRYRANTNKTIDMDIWKGLFGRILTGISVVHLALLTGAAKIYLIGVDHHDGRIEDGLHYHKDYRGEDRSHRSQIGYSQKMNSYINRFFPYKERIIQVQGKYPGHYYGKYFDTVSMDKMPIIEERKIENLPCYHNEKHESDGVNQSIDFSEVLW